MAERERRRAPGPADHSSLRWAVDLSAELQEQRSCPLPVRIRDLSLTGCRLWAGFRVQPGRAARLHVPGFAVLRGEVIRAENWEAALRFAEPLHPAILRHLVAASAATPTLTFDRRRR